MNMEKFFSFNKFFIFFCIFFVIIWLALQAVGYMRLTSMAKLDGERILGWNWPDNARSIIAVYDTQILKKEKNDAVVKVLAKQTIEPITPNFSKQAKPNSNCAVTLTYYRTNNLWFLGKVECE